MDVDSEILWSSRKEQPGASLQGSEAWILSSGGRETDLRDLWEDTG